MNRNGIVEMVFSVLMLLTLTIVAGCGSSGGAGVKWEGEKEVIHNEPSIAKKGPPPWAPAHGHRAKQRYLYFPDCPAYYDTDRSVYFYIEGANWIVSASLPDRLSINLGKYVALELDTDKPYLYYNDHKQKYPPGQAKKNKSNKWAQKGKK